MVPEIYERRSIRKYLDKPIPKQEIADILQSGTLTPSSKNRQPWRYIVLEGQAKEEMLAAFRAGIAREEDAEALLPQSREFIAGAKHTVEIMEQTPVVVFVVNALGRSVLAELTPEERIYEICNIQSASASIQNMLLTATQKGIGSLWICDIYFAYQELSEWLGTEGEPIVAVAFGYPAETPPPRPRKRLEDVVEWRS